MAKIRIDATDGRVLGVVAVTGDLLHFCGTSDTASAVTS